MTNFQLATAIIIGILFLWVIRSLSTHGKLSMRYTFGWSLVGSSAIFCFPLLGVADLVADWYDTKAWVIIICLPFLILIGICVQLSITVSGLTERLRILAEEITFVKAAGSTFKQADVTGGSTVEESDINYD